MSDSDSTISVLRQRIEAFVQAREWEQFHNSKDLANAIAIEASELMEIFLWKGSQEVEQLAERQESRRRIEEELADIVILCLSLANRLDIDVTDAVIAKTASNELKYPAERVRGRADKYSQYPIDP